MREGEDREGSRVVTTDEKLCDHCFAGLHGDCAETDCTCECNAPETADGKQAELQAGLERVIQRARREAEAGAPARMVALYVELEARHALDGHGRAINGVDCQVCVDRVHSAAAMKGVEW